MQKTVIYRIITVLASVAIFIVVGFIAITVPANSRFFYRWQFTKHNTLSWVQSQSVMLEDEDSPDYDPQAAKYVTNMTEAQLEELMMHVMRYCMWLEDDVNITVDGQHLKIFRADERAHLSDVRNLFGVGIIFAIISILGCMAFLFFLLNRPKEYYESSRKVPFITFGVLVGIIAIVAIFALVDFMGTFEVFHQIFFTGNYSFSNGVMISMISDIFTDMAVFIGVGWLVLLAIPIVALILYNKHIGKKIAGESEKQPEKEQTNT